MSPKGSPFHTLEQTGVSKSPKGPRFYNLKTSRFLSLRYSAEFGRSWLVYSKLNKRAFKMIRN